MNNDKLKLYHRRINEEQLQQRFQPPSTERSVENKG